jgi:two-component SAPR family response regulator
MKILVVDANLKLTEKLKELVLSAIPSADVDMETDLEEACYLAERKDYSLIITGAEKDGFDGLKFARLIHDRAPQTKVIFITLDAVFAVPAFKTRAVGYLLAPVTKAQLLEELIDLNIIGNESNHKVEVKTFGNFEMFCDGEIIKFSRAKSKELIAYLIDKNGTTATGSEIIVNLWEDKDVDRTTRSMLHNLVSDIKKTFSEYGLKDVFEYTRNAFRVKKDKIVCDYFDLLDGKNDAKRKFNGEYMSAYDWAEFTVGRLLTIAQN